MAKHAIDYSVFGGPQKFEKWMDVHSALSCPVEVIKDIYIYGCVWFFLSCARDFNTVWLLLLLVSCTGEGTC